MFMTTAGKPDQLAIQHAKRLADEFDIPFVARRKRSIQAIQEAENGEDCLVYGKNRLELYADQAETPFFFHPNVAMVRMKRMMNGEPDPYLVAGEITENCSVLDCTLGLGADALVASFAVGPRGTVVALEANRLIACLVCHGMQTWVDGESEIIEAMRRVEIRHVHHAQALQQLADDSFDVVYFDPMFEENIAESDGIRMLAPFAVADSLTEAIIEEAKRVARKRVVLKDHFRSPRFAQFGFHVLKRKTAKFHYGFIDIDKD